MILEIEMWGKLRLITKHKRNKPNKRNDNYEESHRII